MNDPKTDLQTLLNTMTMANIDSLSTIPVVKRGRIYVDIPDNYIAILNSSPPIYIRRGDNRDEEHTLICEYIINLADSTDKSTLETCVDEVLDELDSVINTHNKTAARTHDFEFYPMQDYSKSDMIITMTFKVTYWAVSI